MKFDVLSISNELKIGITELGYDEMTDIQQAIIPTVLTGEDVIAKAPTGTGKTAAFAIPSIELAHLSESTTQVLVLCPTRELALQITNEYIKLAKHLPKLKTISVYGGQPIDKQIKLLRLNPHIVVGTPGRILDHIKRRTISLSEVKIAILDEADEMLDMGFIKDIDRILSHIQTNHQTILLSATLPKTILEISHKYQHHPKQFEATLDNKDIPSIKQFYIEAHESKKIAVIK